MEKNRTELVPYLWKGESVQCEKARFHLILQSSLVLLLWYNFKILLLHYICLTALFTLQIYNIQSSSYTSEYDDD